MAEIDKFIKTMAKRQLYLMQLVSNKPGLVRKSVAASHVSEQEEVGDTVSGEQLESIIREVVPNDLSSKLNEVGSFEFKYGAPQGQLTIRITRTENDLSLAIIDFARIVLPERIPEPKPEPKPEPAQFVQPEPAKSSHYDTLTDQSAHAVALMLTTDQGKLRNPDVDACRKALNAMRNLNRTLNFSHSIAARFEDGKDDLTITKINSDQFDVTYTSASGQDEEGFTRKGMTKEAVVELIQRYREDRGGGKWQQYVDSEQSRARSAATRSSSVQQTPDQYYGLSASQQPSSSNDEVLQQILQNQRLQAESKAGCMQMGCGCIGLVFFLFLAFVLLSFI